MTRSKLKTDIQFAGMEGYETPDQVADKFCNKLIEELEKIKNATPAMNKTEIAMALDGIITQLQV